MRDWKCGGGSRTAATSKIELIVSLPVVAIVTKSSNVDIAVALVAALHVDIL